MAITYEEALSTLTSMFGDASPPWTEQQLDAVLRHHEGHMENTVETVLGHGDGDPEELVERLQNPNAASAAAASSGGGSSSGATTPVTSNGSSTGNNTRKLRGIKTELPPDFLRIPGHHDYLIDGEAADTIDADEQLAEAPRRREREALGRRARRTRPRRRGARAQLARQGAELDALADEERRDHGEPRRRRAERPPEGWRSGTGRGNARAGVAPRRGANCWRRAASVPEFPAQSLWIKRRLTVG